MSERSRSMPDVPADDQVLRALADSTTWDEPPARLRSQLLATAAVEQRSARADDDVRDRSAESHREDPGEQVVELDAHRRARRWSKILVAAAVLGAVVTGGGLMLRSGADDPRVEISLAAPVGATAALGTAEFQPFPTGMEVVLRVDGLPPADAGTYYAAWLKGESGVVPLGSFHLRGGTSDEIVLWSAVPLIDFPVLMVTVQRVGDPPTPSDAVVLVGSFGAP